ncbi:MAG TPA: calcium/sodium antiporter [bacterium]|nr:calcium/sodium antiporter [bacterium]
MYIFYLLAGVFFLYLGANLLVEGSSAIALKFGVQKMIIGLTVVALGTSMPEFVVSLFGVLEGSDSVSVGNIVGSNIANLLLVLGASALFQPISSNPRSLKFDLPVLMTVIVFFMIFCANGILTRLEGIILLIMFLIYMGYLIKNRKVEGYEPDFENIDREHLVKNILFSVFGIIGLVAGGNLTVKGGVMLANILGVSELTIGLTIVALGTSLPELFTSLVASIKQEHDISVGNVIGSNLFNTAFVLGIIPIISSLQVERRVVSFNNWFMLAAHIVLFGALFTSKKIGRKTGILFLLLYAFFIINLRLKLL